MYPQYVGYRLSRGDTYEKIIDRFLGGENESSCKI